MSKSMKHYSEEQKWSLIRSYSDSGHSKDSYKKKIAIFWQNEPSGAKKSQFFDRISRQEQKNRSFLTELAVRSKKIVIFYRKSEKTAHRS